VKNKKTAINIGAIVAVIIVGAAFYFLTQPKEEVIVNWGARLTEPEIIFLAKKFYEKYGIKLNVIWYPTGVELRDALIAGEVDFAELGVTPAITGLSRSDDMVILSFVEHGGGKYRVVVRKDSPYQTMDDLLGKKIAVKIGSGCYTAFLKYVTSRGWDIKDFEVIDMGDVDAMAALEAGSVDAVVYWEPIPAMLVTKGVAREIFNFEGFVENPVVFASRRSFVEAHKDITVKILAAWIETLEFLRNNPKEAAEIVSREMAKKGIEIPPEAYELSLSHMNYTAWVEQRVIDEFIKIGDLLVEKGKIPPDSVNWDKAFDFSYLEEATKLVKG